MEASATTSEQEEIARLRGELQRVEAQRDRLAAICTEQANCLHEIVHDALIIDRAALAAAAPALRKAPAGSLRAFARLLEDFGEDGATGRAWTGKALGEELGLARANHERLIAPLVAARVIEPVGKPEHKARRYGLHSSLNVHSVRAASVLTRTQRAFGEALGGPSGLILPFPNAHSVRAGALSTRIQCAQPSANAHSVRVSGPVVSSFIYPNSDQSDSLQTNRAAWDGTALEVFGAVTKGQGLNRDIREALLAREPVEAIALVLHARAETTRRPAALLRAMLNNDTEPAPEYVRQATYRLAPAVLYPEPVPYPEQRRTDPEPHGSDEPEPRGLDEKPGGGLLTIRDIWSAVVGQLRLQLNRDTFANVRDAVVLSYADGVITVRPRLPYAALWFDRAREMLDKVVSDVAGVPIAVRCEGQNEAEPAPAQ